MHIAKEEYLLAGRDTSGMLQPRPALLSPPSLYPLLGISERHFSDLPITLRRFYQTACMGNLHHFHEIESYINKELTRSKEPLGSSSIISCEIKEEYGPKLRTEIDGPSRLLDSTSKLRDANCDRNKTSNMTSPPSNTNKTSRIGDLYHVNRPRLSPLESGSSKKLWRPY